MRHKHLQVLNHIRVCLWLAKIVHIYIYWIWSMLSHRSARVIITTPVQISNTEITIKKLQAQCIQLNKLCKVLHGEVSERANGISRDVSPHIIFVNWINKLDKYDSKRGWIHRNTNNPEYTSSTNSLPSYPSIGPQDFGPAPFVPSVSSHWRTVRA